MKIRWIDRHNEKIFKKKVREYVGNKLSNAQRGYFCHIVDDGGIGWGGEFIMDVAAIFYYKDISIKIDIGRVKEYNDFRNETVSSAGDAIIKWILYLTQKWTADGDGMSPNYYGLDWLSSYILNREWEEQK